jgi:site-specific recombinase XerD
MTYPPEPLTRDEVASLLKTCSTRAPTGIRDRALICVLWRAQLRCSEALDLRPVDFDADAGTLRVMHGKGDQSRLAVIDEQGAAVLSLWLSRRREIGLGRREHLFCTLKGRRMDARAVRAMLSRRGAKAGIKKRVHAHGLRHTGASEMVEEGYSLLDIQQQLGHAHAHTTSAYLHQINPKERAERLRKRQWGPADGPVDGSTPGTQLQPPPTGKPARRTGCRSALGGQSANTEGR